MRFEVQQHIWLDYCELASDPKFLPNLSAVAVAEEYLWTASDEFRTIECLAPYRRGYRLHRQTSLNALFPGLPGAEKDQEADVEALEVADGRLWICGSHSLTRRSQKKSKIVEPGIRKRPSRGLLGAGTLIENGGSVETPGLALPFEGEKNLRELLGVKDHLSPFMDLPSKENGFDVEGFSVFRRELYVGLRGPVIDNIAIIAGMRPQGALSIPQESVFLHFVDLGGLGVRDLTRWEEGLLVLAGPVSAADGPFNLFYWKPRRTPKIQSPDCIGSFGSGADHPEGISVLRRDGADGLLVLYDTTNPKRTNGSRYQADWGTLSVPKRKRPARPRA